MSNPRRVSTTLGLLLLGGIVVALALGPLMYPVSPTDQDLLRTLQPPSAAHPLGTDQYGRDVFARILHGGRVSLSAAAGIVATALVAGSLVGWVAASPGPLGRLITRVIDTLLALPGLIVALAVVGALGVGLGNLIIAFVLVSWPWYARLARGFAIERTQGLDVLAARAFGVRQAEIFRGHIVPHAIRVLGVIAALDLGYTVASLSGFSYLGLGAQPPAAEWGAMLNEAQLYFAIAPWLLVGPACGIAVTVLGASLIAERFHRQGLAR